MIPQNDPAVQQRLAQLRLALDNWVSNTRNGMPLDERSALIHGLTATLWLEVLADSIVTHVRLGAASVYLKAYRHLLCLIPTDSCAALADIQANGLMDMTQLDWPADIRPAGAPVVRQDDSTDDEEAPL